MDRTKRQIEELIARADAAFEIPDYEEVVPLADQIIDLGHTYGFELKARALAALDREPEALRVMEEGVTIAPTVGALWSYLGEYRSNACDYAGAHDAFGRAGALDPDLLAESTINDAVVFQRQERPDLALAKLDGLETPQSTDLRGLFARTRADTLLDLGRFDETIDYCTHEIAALAASAEMHETGKRELELSYGSLHVSKAAALWRGRQDRSAAIALCCQVSEHMKRSGEHFALVREIEKLDAHSAKPLFLTCEGLAQLPEVDGNLNPTGSGRQQSVPYLIGYLVLADSPEEGLEFVRRFEPEIWRASLKLRNFKASNEALADGKGVYWRIGRGFAYAKADA